MNFKALSIACVATLSSLGAPSSVLAQGASTAGAAEDLIRTTWPGDAIAKVTQEQFERFAKTVTSLSTVELQDAFLDQQWRWFGVDRAPGQNAFVSPRLERPLPSLSPTASIVPVPEGPEPNTDPNGIFPNSVPTPFMCTDLGAGAVFPVLDSDWWSITQPETGRFVALCGPGSSAGVGAIDDPVLTLRDSSGAVILIIDDSPGRGRFSAIDMDLAAGDYFLEVTGFGNVRTGNYSLDVLCGAPDPVSADSVNVLERFGQNDSVATATAADCDDVCGGTVESPADTDWFRFEVSAPGPLFGSTFAGSGANPIADTVLTLRDASGNVLQTVDDFAGIQLAVIFANVTAGTYFWEVAGGSGDTGSYRLEMTCAGGAQIEPEAVEPNDTMATATSIACGDFGSGQVATASDADWWELTVLRRSSLLLTISSPIGTSLTNARLTLLNENGATVATDAGAGPGVFATINEIVFGGRYFLVIEGVGGSTGDYRIDADCFAPSAPGGASFTVDPATCNGTNGIPTIVPRQFQLPYLGSSFPVDVENLNPSTVGALLIGFSDVTAIDGTALPFDLGPAGAMGCSVDVSGEVVVSLSVDALGNASHAFRIPNSMGFNGLELFFQPISTDPTANSLGFVSGTKATVVTGPLP
ncbi:MAG: pre-peptidase C-terminal domain-containing protein [Planctomycetota bacterium]